MIAFDVNATARLYEWQPRQVRMIMRALQIPPPSSRLPQQWELLEQVLSRKHRVVMPIEIGARVIMPIGIQWIDNVTTEDGITYLWAFPSKFPISECQYLYPNDREGDWYGKCPKCYQNASGYLKRQKIDAHRRHGGYSFCESCLVSWRLPFRE